MKTKYSLVLALTSLILPSGLMAQGYTLEQCRQMALENNHQLQNAQLEIDAAKQMRKEAFTHYFPTVSAAGMTVNANTSMAQMDIPVPIPGVGSLPVAALKNGTIAAVTAVQPVFAGGQIVNSNKLARIGEEADVLKKAMSEDDVIKGTETYFWQIVSMKEKLKTLDLLDEQLKQIHHEVKTAVDAGVATRNDLLRVELQQQQLKSNRLKLDNGITVTTLALAQYIGVKDSVVDLEYTDFVKPATPTDYYVSPTEAVYQRSEFKLMQKSVEAGNLKARIEMGKNLPSVGVGAGYAYHDFTDKDNKFGMVFASVSVPITKWWGGSHAVKRQKIQVRQAENHRDNTKELLEVQITKIWSELNEAYQQIVLAESSITSATENMRLNTDYYEVGLSTLTDVLDAQTLLQQSRNLFTDACAAYQLKLTEYRIATGRL
ncbi:MAG: TolC family protein [Tannerellaceae bacterium]